MWQGWCGISSHFETLNMVGGITYLQHPHIKSSFSGRCGVEIGSVGGFNALGEFVTHSPGTQTI
jgi:hypothetical protein